MFDHPDITLLDIEDVPLDRDIYLMGEQWMRAYSESLLRGIAGGDWDIVGYISYACARHASSDSIDLSWYPNIFDRFHEVRVTLPRKNFILCTELWQYDEKPRIFVSDEWLENLHNCTFSVFALIDAIGITKALNAGDITQSAVFALRDEIDRLASLHPTLSFISFADSLIVKTNWTVGKHDRETNYTYDPEKIIGILPEIQNAFLRTLGVPIYAVVTQGPNEFFGDELTHTSKDGNHISLNSLGLPFAQLQSIETTARQAVRVGDHSYAQLYLDDCFFRSLSLRYDFDKSAVPRHPYIAPMTVHPCHYVTASFDLILSNLRK